MRARRSARSERGQSTVEWIGLVLLVAVLLLGLFAVAGGRLPGGSLARSLAGKLLCAVQLSGRCDAAESELVAVYGPDLAALVADHLPLLRYERGMRALPVDWRRCREDGCAEGPDSGAVSRSRSGEPVVAFVHVVDCRAGRREPAAGADCSGRRRGNAYLQYWFYYPGSATGEGSIPGVREGVRWASAQLGTPSYHPDDWESYQVRLGPDGRASARASSHRGYRYDIDGGLVPRVRVDGTRVRVREPWPRTGWGPATGKLYVSGGSHAGNARARRKVTRITPRSRIVLVPLEPIAHRSSDSFAVTPPWLKRVWRDPEYEGTD